MRYLKQSTATEVAIGPFVDETDGYTAETGLTIAQADIRLKKNGGAWAQTNDATGASHEENGFYEAPLDATDTDTLGVLMLSVSESGARPVTHEFHVLPANVYDSLFSTDKLEVDVAQISGDTTSADNLEESAGVMITGAAIAGTLTSTAMTTDLTEATDDHYEGRSLIFTSGDLTGQAVTITSYDGGTKLVTFGDGTPSGESPTATDDFIIV